MKLFPEMFAQIACCSPADELLVGNSDSARELREWYRDFSRIEPVDAAPIAAAEAQEFFYALQGCGGCERVLSAPVTSLRTYKGVAWSSLLVGSTQK